MRVKIGSQTYSASSLDRVSLGNILKLEAETTALGRPMKWKEIRAMANAMQELPLEEVAEHDDLLWFLAMLVWASRLNAGDQVTFGEAIDFPFGDLDFLPEPSDHQAPANPRKARPASGRAASRAGSKKSARKTSARPSSPA
ncbi:MAG: hypothetical protein ACXVGQ_00370 [Mycobacteriaceae bacterium]